MTVTIYIPETLEEMTLSNKVAHSLFAALGLTIDFHNCNGIRPKRLLRQIRKAPADLSEFTTPDLVEANHIEHGIDATRLEEILLELSKLAHTAVKRRSKIKFC